MGAQIHLYRVILRSYGFQRFFSHKLLYETLKYKLEVNFYRIEKIDLIEINSVLYKVSKTAIFLLSIFSQILKLTKIYILQGIL